MLFLLSKAKLGKDPLAHKAMSSWGIRERLVDIGFEINIDCLKSIILPVTDTAAKEDVYISACSLSSTAPSQLTVSNRPKLPKCLPSTRSVSRFSSAASPTSPIFSPRVQLMPMHSESFPTPNVLVATSSGILRQIPQFLSPRHTLMIHLETRLR